MNNNKKLKLKKKNRWKRYTPKKKKERKEKKLCRQEGAGKKYSKFYAAKLSFRMEGQIKCFPDKVKLKEFINTKPLFYEMLKGRI